MEKTKTFKLTLSERLSILRVERELARAEIAEKMGFQVEPFPEYSTADFERWSEFTKGDSVW
jgi:hypothetical protein